MEKPVKLTAAELDRLICLAVCNQSIEGLIVTSDELAEVRCRLAAELIRNRPWSPSWTALKALAVTLRRPDLLRGGREHELFATGVLMQCATAPDEAWVRVVGAMKSGRRGLVWMTLELVEHGVPDYERTDPIRVRALAAGVLAARSERWLERIRELLG